MLPNLEDRIRREYIGYDATTIVSSGKANFYSILGKKIFYNFWPLYDGNAIWQSFFQSQFEEFVGSFQTIAVDMPYIRDTANIGMNYRECRTGHL